MRCAVVGLIDTVYRLCSDPALPDDSEVADQEKRPQDTSSFTGQRCANVGPRRYHGDSPPESG